MAPVEAEMWFRGQEWKAVTRPENIRQFPVVLSFEQNASQTLEAFESIRKGFCNAKYDRWIKGQLVPKKPVKTGGYFDMTVLRDVSTSAALVMAAEYERKTNYLMESPPIFNLKDWDENLLRKLEQIGFFERFGYTLTLPASITAPDDVLTVPFYSGKKLQMKRVDEKLLRLVGHVDSEYKLSAEMRMALNSAVGEATSNVREHAYPENHWFAYPHVSKWWATGAASVTRREIVVCLYDQGVTIPVSYPKLDFFAQLKSKLNLFEGESRSPYVNDAKLIQAAAEYGNSGRPGRGNVGGFGLPQIKDAINICGGGSLMVLSRGGRYIYEVRDGNKSEDLETFKCSIGGTLIEWTITLPVVD